MVGIAFVASCWQLAVKLRQVWVLTDVECSNVQFEEMAQMLAFSHQN